MELIATRDELEKIQKNYESDANVKDTTLEANFESTNQSQNIDFIGTKKWFHL